MNKQRSRRRGAATKSRFRVGEKVVCIVRQWTGEETGFEPMPEWGRVYVVRGLDTSAEGTDENGPGFYLVGVFGEPFDDGTETSFDADCFIALAQAKANNAERIAARKGLKLDFADGDELASV